eukprot:TRINITY_DN24169_c0_g1_i1.p1 TRINITY_DN24169_c0_g1~~TRINITY_DN24169_c0_g1_i1.p1  ORF type:complete len:230 (-),score=69.40 TRINITY_DN24169_c0_g1_i1:159-782(-)
MGKYAKQTKAAKTKSTASKASTKLEQKRKKVKVRAKAAKRKRLAKAGEARSARRQQLQEEAKTADATMVSTSVDVASRTAGEKLVSFLERQKTENKAVDAVKKILKTNPGPEALGVALGHVAGRGLTSCARLLVEQGALLNIQDPRQPTGRSTPLQIAASRGHVNVCRLLVESGADKAGAAEAAQELAKLGAVFNEEKRAILAVLSS